MGATLQRIAKRELDFWSISSLLTGILLILPLAAVFLGLARSGPKWDHLASTVLGTYVGNTIVLVVTVSLLCLIFALLPAWLVSAFDFPGRKILEWALILPLAIPTYVAAFVYYQVPEAAIPLLIEVRSTFGVDAFLWAEKLLRYGLLSLIMAGVLFPYLFISARASFAQQRSAAIEAARILGRGSIPVFFTVALPLARPAIVAGITLIVMEVINDYGAVNFFGVPTLTEGIFRTWFGLGDRVSALRLAGVAMIAIVAILALERAQRGSSRFAEFSSGAAPLAPRRLGPVSAMGAIVACLIPLAIGFVFPVAQLAVWSAATAKEVITPEFVDQMGRSIGLAFGTAAVLALVALGFSYAVKLHPGPWMETVNRTATIGYAAPGAVVAVGVMVTLGAIDRWTPGSSFLLGGSLFAIVFAYAVRFLTVAYEPVRAGMSRVCGNLDEASRVLGHSPTESLLRIDFPLLRGTLLAAAMLVFVDILKELPLTMILRPANFETLATTAFGLAKEGRIHECAVPSLLIVVVGGTGLVLLNRLMRPSGTRR